MRKFHPYLAVLLAIVLLPGCEQEIIIQPKGYPYVITREPVVSETGVEFRAELADPGKQMILKYGFVWSWNSGPTVQDCFQLWEGTPGRGPFSFRLNSGLKKGSVYYMRAYIRTEYLEVYGNQVSFTSRGSLPPVISGFSPESGPIGTRVEIHGKNFAPWPVGNLVRFGPLEATVDSASENLLVVQVPVTNKPELLNITVETAGMQAISGDVFDLWYPWKRIREFEQAFKTYGISFALGGKGYFLMAGNDLWEFDPVTEEWTARTRFPGLHRGRAIVFTVNGRAYVGMGGRFLTGSYYRDLWEYNPESDTWTRKADFPGELRTTATGLGIGHKGYYGLGESWESAYEHLKNDWWEYDPAADTWTRKADYPSNRSRAFAFTIGNTGYVGLGSGQGASRDIFSYDPASDVWKSVGRYPGKGSNHINGFVLNGKAYMGMGSTYTSGPFDDFWEFDPADNSWREMRPFPVAMEAYLGFTLNETAYLGFGWGDSKCKLLYEFDPEKN